MNIIGVQLILLCFAFFMMYVLFIHWKKKEVVNLTFGVWFFIWIVFCFIALFPQVLEPLIKDLFIIRVMDLAMIGAFMVLTYLIIENNIKIKKIESEFEKLVRKLAIKESKK